MSKDARFASLKTDPRFRRPKQKNLKVEIDERFRDVLESEEFASGPGKGKGKGKGSAQAKVDKHGRPMSASAHQDSLKRFYRLKSPSPDAGAGPSKGGFVDYARGEGYLSSSGSEEGSDEESAAEEEELELGGPSRGARRRYGESEDEDDSEDEESHLDVDLSENEAVLPVAEDEDDEDEDEDEDGPTIPPTTRIAVVNLDWDNMRAADLFSVFNSFLKAGPSKKGSSGVEGRLLDVKIYPSEFGKTRMEKEELEGPGGGVFVSKPGDTQGGKGNPKGKGKQRIEIHREKQSDSEDDQESDEDLDASDDGSRESDEESDENGGEGNAMENDDLEIISDVTSEADEEDIDMDKLRQYQLERLRYFYAVATFSSVDAASHIMTECNGTEFERTANVLDLSYVPPEMSFTEDDVKDVATKEIKGYKGNDFVTDALRHSKVKLTWDQDDPNRVKVTRRTLTRDEIEEQDFKTYLASSESESDDPGPVVDGLPGSTVPVKGNGKAEGDAEKKARKAAIKERTAKLRHVLLAANEEDGDIWGKAALSRAEEWGAAKKLADGGMEITFKPALTGPVPTRAEEGNMTTLEKYRSKVKEKKAKKKEVIEEKRAAEKGGGDGQGNESGAGEDEDEFFGEESESEEDEAPRARGAAVVKSLERRHLPEGSLDDHGDEDNNEEEEEEPLEKPGDKEGPTTHFSMRDILKAEKEASGKRRKRKSHSKARKEAAAEAAGRGREVQLGQEGWQINTKDPRFKAIHEDAEFAIDPSNPHFTKTNAMKELLAERAKVRAKSEKSGSAERKEGVKPVSALVNGGAQDKDLKGLVQSVKRKMDAREGAGKKKRSRH